MKDIKGYEGLYAVTEDGRVWSHRRKKFMSPVGLKDSYKQVSLYKDGVCKQFLIHRLVAEAYIPNPYGYTDVNHKDEIKDHNWADNLMWMSHKDNINYGSANEKRAACMKNGGAAKANAVRWGSLQCS